MKLTALVPLCWMLTGITAFSADLDTWISAQRTKSLEAMKANISPPDAARGAVIASPSREHPNYFYHWVRDAALTMSVVVGLYEKVSDTASIEKYEKMLAEYLKFSRTNQLTNNPSGGLDEHFLGFGEPKFHADGSAFMDHWARPQNDGPALRALTVIRFIRAAQAKKREKIVKDLYGPNSALSGDLEFVAAHWKDSGYDLWEEVKGHHFYTEIVQRRALLEGADLAEESNDASGAERFRAEASVLESEIEGHWSSKQNYLLTTLRRDGGREDKESNLDASVVLAALHAAGDDDYYGPTNERILATAYRLQQTFGQIYEINQVKEKGPNLGAAIGRYPEDKYDGYGLSDGNPWLLLTCALAELNYKAAAEFEGNHEVKITAANIAFFKALPSSGNSFKVGKIFRPSDAEFAKIIRDLRESGDSYLRRIQHHSANGSFAEQINRVTGEQQGAHDLTWSYAAFLTAADSR